MDMDYQLLFNISAGFAFAMCGWIFRAIYDMIKELQHGLDELERQLYTGYVSKDDYRADMLEVKDLLKGISQKLDQKADK